MRHLALPALLLACAGSPAELDPTDPSLDPGAPPSAAQGVAVEPAEPDTFTDLTLVVAAEPTDPDGDYEGLQIRWTRDGEAQPGLDGAWTVPATETERDQLWEASVLGVDAMGHEGDATTAAVSIRNLPPVAPSLTLLPDAPLAGEDDLVCLAQATDPDGDALTYAVSWFYAETVVDGPRVPAVQHRADQEWTCTAVASDGLADSEPTTASVRLIAPPIPGFSLVDLNPTSPRHRRDVSPRDYLKKVSGWYFTHAT